MDSNFTKKKFNLICLLWCHKWDTTNDPMCDRCGKFQNEQDPHYGALFTREARNFAARQLKARRDAGILDPQHDD